MPIKGIQNIPCLEHMVDIQKEEKEEALTLYMLNDSEKDMPTFLVLEKKAYNIANGIFHSTDVMKEIKFKNKLISCVDLTFYQFKSSLFYIFSIWQSLTIYKTAANIWKELITATASDKDALDEFFTQFNMTDGSHNTFLSVYTMESHLGSDIMNVGVAYIDNENFKIKLAEFQDNIRFSFLESLMISHNPKEVILCESTKRERLIMIKDFLLARGSVVTLAQHKNFDLNFSIENIRTLVQNVPLEHTLKKAAMSAASAIIKHLDSRNFILTDYKYEKRYQLSEMKLNIFKMNTVAIKSLNLFSEEKLFFKGYNCSSLYNMINNCETRMGCRLLKKIILQPLKNKCAIENRLDLVTIFLNNGLARNKIKDKLKKIPDIRRLCNSLLRNKSNLQDVVTLYYFCTELEEILSIFEQIDDEGKKAKTTFAVPIKHFYNELDQFKEMVENAIDFEAIKRHEYILKSGIDESLTKISEKKNIIFAKMEKIRDQVSERRKRQKISISGNINGFYLSASKSILNDSKTDNNSNKLNQIEILKTQKNLIIFTTESFTKVAKKYAKICVEYERQTKDIIDQCIKITESYSEVFRKISQTIAFLDVICCFSQFAANSIMESRNYVRPKILEEQNSIKLIKSRHPCLELIKQDFVPNDVNMEKDSSRFFLVTGPNMGGKSTYIRQIGMIMLMAQMGSYVPCELCEVSILSSILARVSANDYQRKGLSTFMTEMLEMSSILNTADENSLIIIDELGRGTSTFDGFGLSMAISEEIIRNIGSFCLFATHFHELTDLESTERGVRNVHVDVEKRKNELLMLYKIKPGASDSSYGIHVAELTDFPISVIDFAKRMSEQLECHNGSKRMKLN